MMDKRLTAILTVTTHLSCTIFFLTHSVDDAYDYLVLDVGFGTESRTSSPDGLH